MITFKKNGPFYLTPCSFIQESQHKVKWRDLTIMSIFPDIDWDQKHHGSVHALLSYVWSIFSRLIWFSKRSQTILFRAIYRPTGGRRKISQISNTYKLSNFWWTPNAFSKDFGTAMKKFLSRKLKRMVQLNQLLVEFGIHHSQEERDSTSKCVPSPLENLSDLKNIFVAQHLLFCASSGVTKFHFTGAILMWIALNLKYFQITSH